MTQVDTLSKEWALRLEERKILGEKRIEEYQQKVDEYSKKRASRTRTTIGEVGFIATCLGLIIGMSVCNMKEYSTPISTDLLIALSITCSIAITSMALAALITRKAQVPGMQNPKDWKNEILNQEASKKESSYGTFVNTVENIPAK